MTDKKPKKEIESDPEDEICNYDFSIDDYLLGFMYDVDVKVNNFGIDGFYDNISYSQMIINIVKQTKDIGQEVYNFLTMEFDSELSADQICKEIARSSISKLLFYYNYNELNTISWREFMKAYSLTLEGIKPDSKNAAKIDNYRKKYMRLSTYLFSNGYEHLGHTEMVIKERVKKNSVGETEFFRNDKTLIFKNSAKILADVFCLYSRDKKDLIFNEKEYFEHSKQYIQTLLVNKNLCFNDYFYNFGFFGTNKVYLKNIIRSVIDELILLEEYIELIERTDLGSIPDLGRAVSNKIYKALDNWIYEQSPGRFHGLSEYYIIKKICEIHFKKILIYTILSDEAFSEGTNVNILLSDFKKNKEGFRLRLKSDFPYLFRMLSMHEDNSNEYKRFLVAYGELLRKYEEIFTQNISLIATCFLYLNSDKRKEYFNDFQEFRLIDSSINFVINS